MAADKVIITITVSPGIPDFEEPLKVFDTRTNYGRDYTDYTFSTMSSARCAKSLFENNGYIVVLNDGKGASETTEHTKYYNGMKIS